MISLDRVGEFEGLDCKQVKSFLSIFLKAKVGVNTIPRNVRFLKL